MNQFCPYCQKVTNVFISDSRRIRIDFKEIIIKNYSCQECGYFVFSKQEELIIKNLS